MVVPAQQGEVVSFDGTTIAWQSFGEGPPVLVANGIGVTWRGMALQIEALSCSRQVIAWDYRGTFGSGPAGSGGVGVVAQARDGLAVLDTLGAASFSLLGWSMGVQVVFEVARLAPDRVTAVASVGGVPWSPFKAATTRGVHRVFRRGTAAMAHVAPAASPALRRLLESERFYPLARTIRYIRPETDRQAFSAMARDVARHDHGQYLSTLAELGQHDARDVLHSLQAPVLFLGGSKDYMIRPSTLRRAAAIASHGRAEVVSGCSHFVLVEAPQRVNGLLEDFLP